MLLILTKDNTINKLYSYIIVAEKKDKKHSVYQHPYREDVFQSEKVSLFCSLIQKEKKDKKALCIPTSL